jgi:hypothetical protein
MTYGQMEDADSTLADCYSHQSEEAIKALTP